jgi:hypothetical protein
VKSFRALFSLDLLPHDDPQIPTVDPGGEKHRHQTFVEQRRIWSPYHCLPVLRQQSSGSSTFSPRTSQGESGRRVTGRCARWPSLRHIFADGGYAGLKIRWVLFRDPTDKRAPQAFFSTDTALAPEEVIAIFVRRWQVEVTFSEVRAHLGVETQRQWSDKAIDRTTPALMGLYSLIVLCAEDLLRRGTHPYAAAWYRKNAFTFPDAIAAVRRRIWIGDMSDTSPHEGDMPKIPPDRLRRMADALCFAA